MWQGLESITGSHITSDEFNEFYARFEALNTEPLERELVRGSTLNPPFTITSADVIKTLRKINPRKAAGPDNIPGRALKTCAWMLADVFADIFNLSLSQTSIPTCLKTTTIIPVPKKGKVTCLNDYRPIALTPIVMKCFERIVMSYIKTIVPDTLDPYQFA